MWTRILVTLLAIGCLAYGVYGLVRPEAAAGLVSLVPTAPEGVGEIRAVYGGLMIALGLLLLGGSLGRWTGGAWLAAVGIGFAGLFVGRLVSLAVDGLAGYTLMAAVLEGVVAGLLFVAAAEQRRRRAPGETMATKPGTGSEGSSRTGPSPGSGAASSGGAAEPQDRQNGPGEGA